MTDKLDRKDVQRLIVDCEEVHALYAAHGVSGAEGARMMSEAARGLTALLAERDALEANRNDMRMALAEAIYMLDPDEEDILKGAGIYRIVLAYEQAGGVLPGDLKYALAQISTKKEKSVTLGTYDG